jgi:predicted transcriptional regulator
MTDALRIMREKGMKRIAVVKNGQLLGMLTQQVSLKESEPMKVAAKK